MTSDLAGKKLLILGANPETVPLIKTAQELGVYVIVTDYDPGAYAKRFANKGVDVDGRDVQGLITLARQEGVDGVLVGVADRLIIPYQQVCEALNFPCYGTREQCEIFTDKQKFSQLCHQYGITPIPSFSLDRDFSAYDLEKLQYPVFIKPVDGCSGKGMSICCEKSQVDAAVEKAITYSLTGRFLVERYMDCDDMLIYFTFKDGEIWLSATADRYTSREQGNVSRVCIGAICPSRHVDLYFDALHEKLCRMFKDIKIKDGVFLISAFVEEGVFYVYDPGFRLQGEALNLHIEAINGFDQKAMLIRLALTGSMGDDDLGIMNDYQFRGKCACTIWFLAKEGIINRIEGLEAATEDQAVTKVFQRLYEGDAVTREMVGTEAQVVARLYMVCETREEMRFKVRRFQNVVKVYNEKGHPMLLNGFDSERI